MLPSLTIADILLTAPGGMGYFAGRSAILCPLMVAIAMAWIHERLTSTIIGAYYDVFNATGRAYPEIVYERALAIELERRGVACRRQVEYEVWYKERLVGRQQLDLLANEEVVVELKVAPRLEKRHKAQAISYLKAADKEVGLLFNFGGTAPEVARLHRPAEPVGERPGSMDVEGGDGLLRPDLTEQVRGGLYEVHSTLGPGFIQRIYVNAVRHELGLRGLAVAPRRVYEVFYRDRPVGKVRLRHLEVEGLVLVFPVAVEDVWRVGVRNLRTWMDVQRIPLGLVANFHPTRLGLVMMRGKVP